MDKHDYRKSEGIFKIIESLFPENIEYGYKNFYSVISEMEKDINKKVTEFLKSAHGKYIEYIEKIIAVVKELVGEFSGI